jgi:hypothetical protein
MSVSIQAHSQGNPILRFAQDDVLSGRYPHSGRATRIPVARRMAATY